MGFMAFWARFHEKEWHIIAYGSWTWHLRRSVAGVRSFCDIIFRGCARRQGQHFTGSDGTWSRMGKAYERLLNQGRM